MRLLSVAAVFANLLTVLPPTISVEVSTPLLVLAFVALWLWRRPGWPWAYPPA